MIYGKSSHPIEIKRIPLELWSVRQEIEAYLAQWLQQHPGQECDLEAVRKFYELNIQEIEIIADELKAEPIPAPSEPALAAPEETPAPESSTEAPTPLEAVPQEAAPVAPTLELVKNPNSRTSSEVEKVLQFQRVKPTNDVVSAGFAFLVNINMEGVLLFSKYNFMPGQEILIEFLIPRGFTLSGYVVYTKDYVSNSRIISEKKAGYRLYIRFSFTKPAERTNLREFLSSVEPEIPKKKAKKKKTEDEEDDLLGL